MSAVERLLQEARALPSAEQIMLAALLIQQAQHSVPVDEDRRAAFRRVRGKYKHLPFGTAELQAEKHQELELEERRYKERFTPRQETA